MDKVQLKQREEAILLLIRDFSDQYLDDEYFELSVKMVQKLGRKKTQPLATGKVEIWAAAIIHALGSINFLFDKASKPYVKVDDISTFFGTNKNTTSGKSRFIRDTFNLGYFDSEFGTRKMADSNPFNNLVMVDGLIVPVDSLPEPYQAMVREARAKGEDISFSTR